MVVEEKHVKEIKKLSDKITERLLDLDKCSLNELITLLQNFANDPPFNVHRT
jgi:DNA-binding ferritin-like protein